MNKNAYFSQLNLWPKVPLYFWVLGDFQGLTPTTPRGRVSAKSTSPPPVVPSSQIRLHNIGLCVSAYANPQSNIV